MSLALPSGLMRGKLGNAGLGMRLDGPSGQVIPFTPFDLGAKLVAWFDASQGITTAGAGVSAWVDRKAGIRATQGTSASRPIMSVTEWVPSLYFDGLDDFLSVVSPSAQPFPSAANPSEIWATVQQDAGVSESTSGSFILCYGGITTGNRRLIERFPFEGVNRARARNGNNNAEFTVLEPTTNFSAPTRHIVRGVFGVAVTKVGVDNTPLASTAVVPGTGNTRARIGGNLDATTVSGLWKGKIRDIIVTTELTDAEADKLRAFLIPRKV